MNRLECADRLLDLRSLIHPWITEQCRRQHELIAKTKKGKSDPVAANLGSTRAYADLTLAFGLSRRGEKTTEVHQLLEGACRELDPADETHSLLFRAYACR